MLKDTARGQCRGKAGEGLTVGDVRSRVVGTVNVVVPSGNASKVGGRGAGGSSRGGGNRDLGAAGAGCGRRDLDVGGLSHWGGRGGRSGRGSGVHSDGDDHIRDRGRDSRGSCGGRGGVDGVLHDVGDDVGDNLNHDVNLGLTLAEGAGDGERGARQNQHRRLHFTEFWGILSEKKERGLGVKTVS